MPIAKYMQNLGGGVIPPPPPEAPVIANFGGPFFKLNEDGSPVEGESVRQFETRLLAWELGYDSYVPGKPIKLSQFTFKVYDDAYDKPNPMRDVIAGINAQDDLRRRARTLEYIKVTTVIAGVSYSVWKLILVLL